MGNPVTEAVAITRLMPDLDFICENENRLWGCCDNTIYASKLGDPFNWNVFDGLSTDSFAANVGSDGAFTGCISYLGYPHFFKEDNIYKVYGDKPQNFQVVKSAGLGVMAGSEKSLAILGGTLFYLSREGWFLIRGACRKTFRNLLGTSDTGTPRREATEGNIIFRCLTKKRRDTAFLRLMCKEGFGTKRITHRRLIFAI